MRGNASTLRVGSSYSTRGNWDGMGMGQSKISDGPPSTADLTTPTIGIGPSSPGTERIVWLGPRCGRRGISDACADRHLTAAGVHIGTATTMFPAWLLVLHGTPPEDGPATREGSWEQRSADEWTLKSIISATKPEAVCRWSVRNAREQPCRMLLLLLRRRRRRPSTTVPMVGDKG